MCEPLFLKHISFSDFVIKYSFIKIPYSKLSILRI